MATKKRKTEEEEPTELLPDPAAGAVDEEVKLQVEEEEEEEESVPKLLEPLTKEQLIALLASASSRDPSTLDEIRTAADLDPSHRKLFVHGLGWDTTSDALFAAFASHGEIDDCRVVVDKSTGKSKGYGFVIYRHRAGARAALRSPEKFIDNRKAYYQLACVGPTGSVSLPNPTPNPTPNPNPSFNFNPKDNLPRKIYVGNVPPDADVGRLRDFFARYGEIEEGPIGFDRSTGKSKGFALFVFRTAEAARKALEESNKNFEGHLLYCQKATDSKSKANTNAAAPHPNAGANSTGFNGYGAPPPEMGIGQQGSMLGQGAFGMGWPQAQPFGPPNTAAIATLLAAASQNPAAFGITPSVLASFNPGFAAPHVPPTQGYGTGGMGYQNPPYQGPSGFQGNSGYQSTPGFHGTQPPSGPNQVGGGSYQGGPMNQGLG